MFDKIYFAQFQAVESVTRSNGGGPTQSGPMWEAVLDATGRSWGFHYNVLGISPEFRTDNGFVPRTGFVQPSAANRITLYGKPGALIERFNVFITENALWDYDDFFGGKRLLEDHFNPMMSWTLRGGWNVNVSPRLSSYAFDRAPYSTLYVPAPSGGGAPTPFVPSDRIETLVSGFSVATPQHRTWAASAGTTIGNDVDFLETSRVRRTDVNGELDWRPNERLRAALTYTGSAFTRRSDGERTMYARIPRVKIEYQLARPLFVRVVSQYTSMDRQPLVDPRTGQVLLVSGTTGFTPSAAASSNTLRTDWLVSYRPSPGTVFFVGYGGDLEETDPLAFRTLRRTDDSFFVKASYVFRLPVF